MWNQKSVSVAQKTLGRILIKRNTPRLKLWLERRDSGAGRCVPPKARTGTKSAPVRMASLTKPLRRLSTRRRECGCASNDSRAPPTTIVMPLPIPSPFSPPRESRFSQDSRDTEASPIDSAYSRYLDYGSRVSLACLMGYSEP